MTNPSEPSRPESGALPGAPRPDACFRCGTVLPPASLLYNEHGQVTCQRCLLVVETSAGLVRAAAKVRGIAYGGPVVGLMAFVFNPLFLLSVATVLNGLYVFRALKEAENRAVLAPSAPKMKVAAVAGIALGVLAAALRIGTAYMENRHGYYRSP